MCDLGENVEYICFLFVILLLPTGYCMFSWKPEHFELLNHHLLNLYSLFIKRFKCTVRSKPFYGVLPAEMKY